jgi:imidazolonepropionase-like amidohydrolase
MIALVEDSSRIGKRVASHCHGTPSIVNSVAAKVTTIEHCSFRVPGGLNYEQKVADSVAEAGIYVVPTLSNGWRRMQKAQQEGLPLPPGAAQRDQRAYNLRRLIESGVQIVSGSDAGMSFTEFDDFQLDLEHLVEFVGFSAEDAIVTATGRAAEAIGSDDFGVLASGKRADILGVNGNALEQIEQLRDIALVLKSGRPVVGDLPPVA